jgi:virginiamycin B lyase
VVSLLRRRACRAAAQGFWLALLLLGVSVVSWGESVVFSQYSIPTPGSDPIFLTTGPDGAQWFTERDGNKIGRITTSGQITEYAVPTAGANPYGIAAGPDGALWFTEVFGNNIGRITLSGVITEYAVPTPDAKPWGIASGPDGALWFAEQKAGQIGRITTSGTITEYEVPTSNAVPFNIATGPDGALWFTEEQANQIGRISTAGVITAEYPVPTAASVPECIAMGPDGALWFTEYAGNKIGRITTSGAITEYAIPTPSAGALGITTGPDGALWFAEGANQIGRVTTSGAITQYSVSSPQGITTGPDGALWFTESGANQIGRAAISPLPLLTATPTSLGFSYQQGGSQPLAQVVSIASSGATVSFTATASTASGGNWLSVSPASGSTPASLSVSVDTAGLSPNTYSGSIIITSAGAANSPVNVPVTLVVSASSAQYVIFTTFNAPGAGTGQGQGTFAISLNDSEGISGNYVDASDVGHGFTSAANGAITTFDVPGAGTGSGQGSYAGNINLAGTIAGQYLDVNNVYHGYVRAASGVITTFDAPGAGTSAYQGTQVTGIDGLNDAGAVAGLYQDASTVYHGYVRAANGAITSFDVAGAGTGAYQGTYTSSINDAGAITGPYQDASNVYHGYVRAANGAITTFDVAGAGTGAYQGTAGYAINDAGTIAGQYTDASNAYHGFVRADSGVITTFDAPGAGTGVYQGTETEDINAAGVITGSYIDASNVYHGFVRAASGTITTFNVPGAGTGPGLGTFANAINDGGAIAGYYVDAGNVAHAFLTLPNLVSTPASLTFNYQQGGDQPASQTLGISTPSGSSLPFSAVPSSSGNWLSVNPGSGATSASLMVSVNAAGLTQGVYSGVINLFSTGAANSTVIVPVTLTVQEPPSTITSISPTSAAAGGTPFTLTVNGSNFIQCAAAPCLGVTWQPATGGSSFIFGQANAAGTQLTVAIPATLLGAVGTANVSVQAAGGTSNSLPFTVTNPAATITGISPASVTAGGAAFTLTVNGFGFIQCAAAPCLGVSWQPASGASTFISGQANATGTQLTATIPAELIGAAGTATLTVQAAGGTSSAVPFIIASATAIGSQTGAGHLLFPNVGLNALQEFDAASKTVVNTIPLPAPFTYSGSSVVETVLIRQSDGGILTNAYTNGNSAVVALSNSGQFVAAQQVSGGAVQELGFDPLDSTQSTVLAGSLSSADVIAVDPYSGTESTRIGQKGASYTGVAIDSVGRVYAGNSATGQIFRYLSNGTQGSVFADVQQATGSSEIDALAIDSGGNVYAAQGSSNRIAVFNSSGTFLNLLTDPGFNGNTSVYFNPNDGLLYAGNQADDALTILTTAGTPVAVVHMGGKTVGVPDVVPGAPVAVQAAMETTLTGLTFLTPQGGSAPPPQSFAVVNNSSAAFSFTTSVSTTSGGSWLMVTGGSGSAGAGQVGAPISVSVNPSGLAAGDYYGTIEIDAAEVANSPQYVTVVLNILPATANPGASVNPTGMIFTAVVNGTNPAVQSVAVSDVLSRSTSFTATSAATTSPSWFTVTPSSGTVQPGQTVNIQVQANVANLPAGVYSGTLTLQFPQDNVTRQIALLLVVSTSATEVAQGKYAPRDATVPCQPTELLMVFTTLGDGFTTFTGWPATLEALVVDDCGVPMVSGTVTVTFSDHEAPVKLRSALPAGTWLNSWTPPSTTSVILTATAAEGALTGSVTIGGTVQSTADVPVLNAGGIVSAASYSPIAIPSPGEIVSIFGSNLADGTESATQLPLPTQMQNAFVVLGGQTMPLLFVSPKQINAVVPYGLTGGTPYQAVARHGSSLSLPQQIPVAAADPAFFTTNQTGQGQGHIYVEPGNILAGSSTPATAGDVLTMYCTGLGAVTQPVTAGSAAPSQPLAYTAGTVSVTIGGQPATVSFAGLAPGFAGLYQINAKVPSGVPTGDQIPVVITVDKINSPYVTIAVK